MESALHWMIYSLLMEIILITWVENMDYMEEAQKRTQVKTKNFRLNSSGDVCWMNLKGDVKMDHMRVKVEQKSVKFVRYSEKVFFLN